MYMGWFMALFKLNKKKKKPDFFELLYLQASKTYEGIKVLDSFFQGKIKNASEIICELEHDTDEYRRFIIDDLNQTFITPLDRKDIYAISRAIDDIMDMAKAIVEEVEVFEVEPNQYMKIIASTLSHAMSKLADSFKHLKERPNLSREAAVRSNLLLNNLGHLYIEAIKDLAESGGEISYLFKIREVFHRLFELVKQINYTNNRLLDTIVKTW